MSAVEWLKKTVEVIRRIAAWAAVCYIANLFTAYLDGDIGVVLWSFLIIAPLLSELLRWLASRRLAADLEAPVYVAKGKRFSVKTILNASGRLPVPFVRCTLSQTGNLQPEDPRPFQTAMLPGKPLEVQSFMTAAHAGCGEVRLERMLLSDFLGETSAALQDLPETRKIGVIPEIPVLAEASVMLRAVTDLVQTQDEDEEESSAMFSSVASPGYIHRDYVPGDNLRRINWKLSAKRGKFMVRMDEAAATVRPTLLLDLPAEDAPKSWEQRSLLMEGALGFLDLLVQQGVACSLRFPTGGRWECLPLENEEHVRQAAVALATADFSTDGNRLDPDAQQDKAGAFLVYSSHPDAGLSHAMRSLREQGYVSCVTCPELPVPTEADAVWHLSADFRMTAVQK